MRRGVHAAFSYSATYEDEVAVTPVPLSVRWHNDREIVGNIGGGDYAEIASLIRKIIFNKEEIAAKALTLRQGGLIKLTGLGDYQLELDVQEPPDGPINEIWTVVRP